MSWQAKLQNSARSSAGRRKRIYGTEPPPAVSDLLAPARQIITLRNAIRLFLYTYFESPLPRLRFVWQRLTDRDTPVRRRRIHVMARKLQAHIGESGRVAASYFERRNCSRDLARVPPLMEKALYRTTPHLVVQPAQERDILETLAFARSQKLAVYARGAGSYAFGGAVPTRSGIVLDLSPMMAVLDVDPDQRTVRVQPGARWADVASKLEAYGLAPLTSPTSRFSTVAGWISTGGIGLDGYAHGSVYGAVKQVRVARPDGRVEELDSSQESLKDLFSTEGQFGILTEITLKVRPKAEYSGPCLLDFETRGQAVAFLEKLTKSAHLPSHVAYFDRAYAIKENTLFGEHTGSEAPIIPERELVLLHFEAADGERKFLDSLNGNTRQVDENRTGARYLWSDRFYPLKAQRIGPGLLGTEVVIPLSKISNYQIKVERLARSFGILTTFEVILSRDGQQLVPLVLVSFSCDYSKSLHYSLSLLFIQLLVKSAVSLGGHPYGIGIWNTPFAKSKYGRGHLRVMKARKREIDPGGILNPHKFFKIRSRFLGLPGLMLRPVVFRFILSSAHLFAPFVGLLAKLSKPEQQNYWDVPSRESGQGRQLLFQSIQRCTSCGSCISVCPAYHITRDALVTGRTKLRMAETLMKGEELEPEQAHASFQCLHCGLCEEVCQTRLPLRECYLALEDWIEAKFGSPEETVRSFIERLDGSRDYIKDIFGLDLPAWSPDDQHSRVPAAAKPSEEAGE
jgi:FAD/FMN-containing dehydrogenase/ferredoxin